MTEQIRHLSRRRAFTAIELLVVIVIVIILLSIFIPYALKLRESNHRTQCASNLRQIFQALQTYARLNGSYFPRVIHDPNLAGYTAFTGRDDPDPFAANSRVRPNDVTASLWLLVRGSLVQDTRVFICPSTDDSADMIRSPQQRSNFRSAQNLSYSYACPFSPVPGYKVTDTMRQDFAIMADANPGGEAGRRRVPMGAPQSEQVKINSRNHGGAGQNVLYAYGAVTFQWNPYCATDNDDIYTAQLGEEQPAPITAATRATSAPLAATMPATVPATAQGMLGPHAFPVSPTDSFLVPARTDPITVAPLSPASSTTTTAPASTAPATSQTAPG